MKKVVLLFVILGSFFACKTETLEADRFKAGVFEIPEGKGYSKTIITRIDTLQIEQYENKIDTLIIEWKNNFNYTLKMVSPKNAIDKELIHVKITSVKDNSYEFESVIGRSNFITKGELFKISD